MENAHDAAVKMRSEAKLGKSTPVFLVGSNIEATMAWYQAIGFEVQYFPPGFCILRRDAVEIFLQVHDGYVRPDDPGARERGAWNAYIETDNVEALFDQISKRPNVKILRPPHPQPYGQTEFEVVDPNGYVLVFAQPVY
jgi:predicted enzyme related to lactoylglutathione lyase